MKPFTNRPITLIVIFDLKLLLEIHDQTMQTIIGNESSDSSGMKVNLSNTYFNFNKKRRRACSNSTSSTLIKGGNVYALKRYESTEVDRKTWLHVPS